jgi:cytochrome P450
MSVAACDQSTRLHVSFQPAPTERFWKRWALYIAEIGARIGPTSFRHAASIVWHGDFSRVFLQIWKPQSFVCDFPTFEGTVYVTAEPDIIKAVLMKPRRDVAGFFDDVENRDLVFQGIKDLYPEEVQKMRQEDEDVTNLLAICAEASHLKFVQPPLRTALGPKNIDSYSLQLEEIAQEMLGALTQEERSCCNAADLASEYAATVISKLLLGYQTDRKKYQEIAGALDVFSKRMSCVVSRLPATPALKRQYTVALAQMKQLIQEMVDASPSPGLIASFREQGWSEFQIKANIFFLYFAGIETTSASMNYLIGQLGQRENEVWQQAINDPDQGEQTLLRLIAEALRLHPPAFIIGRQLRDNTLMTVRDSKENILCTKQLRKGHSIICLIQAAGRDPIRYPQPDQFNPERFTVQDVDNPIKMHRLPFSPFGYGVHLCPGQHLALAQIRTFIKEMVKRFFIHSLSSNMKQTGIFVLRTTPAHVRLEPRCQKTE